MPEDRRRFQLVKIKNGLEESDKIKIDEVNRRYKSHLKNVGLLLG